MKKQVHEEIHILGRLMYVLEEHSVSYISKQDMTFAQYINEVYASLGNKATDLRKLV